MQGFKKVLVALLVVMTILGTMGPVFAAPADVQGTKYEDAAVRLMALGIFKGDDKGNFNPDMPISRAEATAIIIRALGLEKSAELMKGVTKFADVNADPGLQWATGAINIAVSQGIIKGYPDGRFGGRDNVTYAQLAKMILYALNYGITVEGGVWPTAVLAKADDLGILDGLAVVADAPITRGDAAKMLDNSLDVKSLKQTGYGSLTYYEETGQTLLEKLGLDEIEGRVVAVPAVDSGLEDDEVTLEVNKKNGAEVKPAETKTYTQLQGVDVQSLFGLEAKVWVNSDDQVVFVEKKTSDKDIYTDAIKEFKGDNVVKLDVLDDTVTFADDATIYVNNEKVSVSDFNDSGANVVGYYGRFVKKNNKIAFAWLFKFDYNGVVTSVGDNQIKYFSTTNKVRTLDLTDADKVYVYNADLTASELDNIAKDNVVYWYQDGDNYYLVVSAKKVEGTLTKAKNDKVTVAGKDYKIYTTKSGSVTAKYAWDGATYTLNADDDIALWTNNAADLDDLDGENVVLILGLSGHVRHLRGDAKQTTGTQYGVVTGVPSDGQVTVFTKDGEEVTYDIDKKADWGKFDLSSDNKKFYGTGTNLGYFLLAYEVNSDGKIAESGSGIGTQYAVKVLNAEPADSDITIPQGVKAEKGIATKGKDDEFILVGTKKFYVDSNTVIMRTVKSSDGSLDPELLSYNDFKDLTLEGTTNANNRVVVFGEDGKNAKAIFFVHRYFAGSSADTYYAVVTDAYRQSGKNKVEVDVFDGAKTVYVVGSGSPAKGQVVVFKLNAKGEYVDQGIAATEATVVEIDGYYATVVKKVYDASTGWKMEPVHVKIDPDAVVYDQKDDYSLNKKIDAANIAEFDRIKYVADNGVIKAVVKEYTKTGRVTSTSPFAIDGKAYDLAADALVVDKDGDIFSGSLAVGDDVVYQIVGGKIAYLQVTNR